MSAAAPNAAEIKHELFLEELARTGHPASAAKKLGYCNASGLYQKRKDDPEFAARWEAALDAYAGTLEAEAHRRAVQGISKPVVYQGGLTYLYETDANGRTIYDLVDEGKTDPKTGEAILTKAPRPQLDEYGQPKVLVLQEYSDSLLALLLKAKCPGFKDRIEVANPPGETFKTEETPIQIARKVAFALALGLRAAEKQEATGEDLA